MSTFNGLKIDINVLGPIKNSSLMLSPGITVIFGPTSSGKSILLGTIASMLYCCSNIPHDIPDEILSKYISFTECDLIVNNAYRVTSKKQIFEIKPEHCAELKNKKIILYYPSTRLATFHYMSSLYRAIQRKIIANISKGLTIYDAIQRAMNDWYVEITAQFIEMFNIEPSKLQDKEIINKIKLYAKDTFPWQSFVTFYNSLIYLLSMGLLSTDKDLYDRIEEVFREYFGLGAVDYNNYTLYYVHPSNYRSTLSESSDGIKEIISYIVIFEALKDNIPYVIIDEIEIHLYPKVLLGLLNYMLDSSIYNNTAFLISSHSLFTLAWAIKHILKGDSVRLYVLSKRNDGYYELKEPNLDNPIEGFEDLYMELLMEHRKG